MQGTTHFIFSYYLTVQTDNKFLTRIHWSNKNDGSQLEHLQQKQFNHDICQIIGHDTYFKQMLTSTETSLQRGKRQDDPYVRVASRWRPFQLSLFLKKELVLSPTSF